ncbi:MAG: hypothetical protein SGCHY_001429 [Lobulomycetales sp.]
MKEKFDVTAASASLQAVQALVSSWLPAESAETAKKTRRVHQYRQRDQTFLYRPRQEGQQGNANANANANANVNVKSKSVEERRQEDRLARQVLGKEGAGRRQEKRQEEPEWKKKRREEMKRKEEAADAGEEEDCKMSSRVGKRAGRAVDGLTAFRTAAKKKRVS